MREAVKVIFCLNRNFTNRDYRRFGCTYLEKKGYAVEVWNIGAERYRLVEIPHGYYQGTNVRNMSRRETMSVIKKYTDAVYIILDCTFQDLLFHLKKHHCHVIMYMSAGSLEYVLGGIPRKRMERTYGEICKEIAADLWDRAIRKNTAAPKYNADYYILNTHQCLVSSPETMSETRVLYLHTGDYDRYLEVKQNGISVSEDFILYVDSGFGLVDIDSVMHGYKDPWREKPQQHAASRNAIFEKLEKHYGLPVVIAGHPHTDYGNADFGGRNIVFDQTCELTAKAKFIILEWSTAVSYAILFAKPIMVLIDDDMIKHGLFRRLFWANYRLFDLQICNMDIEKCQAEPWKYVNVIVNEMRKKYFFSYIKEAGTPEKLSYEVLEQIIQKICLERG